MATDPLNELIDRIKDATVLPDPEPYNPSEDPLTRLRSILTAPADAANDTNVASQTASEIADELLDIFGRTPLQGDARRRAIEAAYAAKKSPTAENIQRVLDILVGG